MSFLLAATSCQFSLTVHMHAKTGSEKDLTLTRVERGDLPCYFVTSLPEMAHYGGTDAQSIKEAIDHGF